MIYGSVCSGIEAASEAWKPLGWKPAWFAEISQFSSRALEVRHPEAPNLGDMTEIENDERFKRSRIELLVGGTPCQSFSVAGLRGGLEDPRGNLALVFLRILDRARPAWVVWENVPGVLSSGGGRDFATFLGGLRELGYGFAYRVLDAQYFGLAQQRKRVFVVGYLGDWRRAAAVLFERESMSGHPAPLRQAREDVASTVTASSMRGGGATAGNNPGLVNPILTPPLASCLTSRNARNDAESTYIPEVSRTLTASPDASPDGTKGYPIVALAENQRGELRTSEISPSLGGLGGKVGQGYQAVNAGARVRRLTPREWERLQGFPDDYTLIDYRGKPAKDTPRYEAIGNSMPVAVMRWIGERIQAVHTMGASPKGE